LAERFQRRRLKCEKLTDAKWWQKLTLPLARWANQRLRPPSYAVNFFKNLLLWKYDQWKPNLVWIITRVSSLKIVSGDVHQPSWQLLLNKSKFEISVTKSSCEPHR
jgi:hypothetical protein